MKWQWSFGCPRAPRAALACAALIVAPTVWAQPETGPQNQTVPWHAPQSHPFNSVVEINAPAPGGFVRIGTGSVIGKQVVNGVGWFCVLTADHVVDPVGINGPHVIAFGDNGAQGVFGGATNIVKRGLPPVANGGLNKVDIAVLGIRYGQLTPQNEFFFNSITPLTMLPGTPQSRVGTTMTELGYGGTGSFVAGGMNVAPPDGNKRFQNNRIERTINYNDGTYMYTAVEWDFDNPAGIFAVPGEGSSYGGDSGGPYMTTNEVLLNVGGGNFLNAFSNGIIAVHTYGDNNPAFHAFWNTPGHQPSGGVPLTQAYVTWIEQQCMMIPAPGTLILLTMTGVLAYRRRR